MIVRYYLSLVPYIPVYHVCMYKVVTVVTVVTKALGRFRFCDYLLLR